MKTPIVVYSTDQVTKYTDYYSPTDQEFYEGIQQNAYNKYTAYYGVEPDSYIEIQKIQNSVAKKMVTKYQGHYIIAWYGEYILSGKRKYLDFLYQVGIGAKNSQGFGMIEML
jgi:CRISPR-associated endoribonuclease Cas6